jgi:hypothetical protein
MKYLKELFEFNQFIIKSFLLIKLIKQKNASLNAISKKYNLLENRIISKLIEVFLSNYHDRLEVEDQISEYYKIYQIDSSYLIYNLLLHKCQYFFTKNEFSFEFFNSILLEKEIEFDYDEIEINLDEIINNLLLNELNYKNKPNKLKEMFNAIKIGCLYDFIWPNKEKDSSEKEVTQIDSHIDEIILKIIETILDKIDDFEKIRIILMELNKSKLETENFEDEKSKLSLKRSASKSSSSLLTDDLSISSSIRDSKMPRLMSENLSMSLPLESLFKCSSPLKLQINKLPGIGSTYAKKLNQNSVQTFGDLIDIYEKKSNKDDKSFHNEMKSLINMKNDSINRLIYLIKSYLNSKNKI